MAIMPSLPREAGCGFFKDVTLRLELGDLLLQGCDLGQIGTAAGHCRETP